jgi:hypothetical protein
MIHEDWTVPAVEMVLRLQKLWVKSCHFYERAGSGPQWVPVLLASDIWMKARDDITTSSPPIGLTIDVCEPPKLASDMRTSGQSHFGT